MHTYRYTEAPEILATFQKILDIFTLTPQLYYERTPVQTGSAGYILILFASSQEGASNERPYSEVWI